MELSALFIASLLMAGSASASQAVPVALKDGPNTLDINQDGANDLIFSATYDNNTSHPSSTLTVYIQKDHAWLIVPVPDDDGFTWSDFRLSASTTKISGYEPYQVNHIFYLVRAVKIAESSESTDLTDATKVKFTRYRIASNSTDPGVAAFFWQPSGSYVTDAAYSDVDDAFRTLNMDKFL
ncbi:CpmJ protein [Cronobacter malonaticus]|uniref:carbapenem self-resistance protein CarG family protein n=1 Tax=Cronobacter malonaticus TaxID=413503 RepID=UPI002DBD2D38|nr:CpmJ protein [Cronobacter malonaticus]MEB8681013.1 CpmJ protein [Cronobacter malonaticus]